MKQRIVFFDFDNTIVNSLDYWYKVMDKESFKHFKVKPRKEFKKIRKGLWNYEIAINFIKLNNLNIKPEEVIEFWNNRMEYYYTNKIHFIKGVEKFIQNLHKEGKELVLVSATNNDLLEISLKLFKLDKYFSKIITEKSTGYSKHNTNYLLSCLKECNAQNDDVFFFEDSVVSLRCAKQLNIKSCGVIGKYNKDKIKEMENICEFTIKNYNKLIK